MPKRECDAIDGGISVDLLRKVAIDLGGEVYLAIQGYPFTTLGRFDKDRNPELPPVLDGTSPDLSKVAWDLFQDVRVFGEAGDWHAWRVNSGIWRGGMLRLTEADTVIEREYILWGEEFKPENGWTHAIEKRGAGVWIPRTYSQSQPTTPKLVMKLLVNYDENGLAGIVDTALCGFK